MNWRRRWRQRVIRRSRAGDFIRMRAEMDLVIGLTACAAYASNGGSFKSIGYTIE